MSSLVPTSITQSFLDLQLQTSDFVWILIIVNSCGVGGVFKPPELATASLACFFFNSNFFQDFKIFFICLFNFFYTNCSTYFYIKQIILKNVKTVFFYKKIKQFSVKIYKILEINKYHLNTPYIQIIGHLKHFWPKNCIFCPFFDHFPPY